MDLGQTGCCGVEWIGLAQNRDQWRVLLNAVMNLRVIQYAGKFLSGCKTAGLSGSAQLHRVSWLVIIIIIIIIIIITIISISAATLFCKDANVHGIKLFLLIILLNGTF
jgi:hypothetical protein